MHFQCLEQIEIVYFLYFQNKFRPNFFLKIFLSTQRESLFNLFNQGKGKRNPDSNNRFRARSLNARGETTLDLIWEVIFFISKMQKCSGDNYNNAKTKCIGSERSMSRRTLVIRRTQTHWNLLSCEDEIGCYTGFLLYLGWPFFSPLCFEDQTCSNCVRFACFLRFYILC